MASHLRCYGTIPPTVISASSYPTDWRISVEHDSTSGRDGKPRGGNAGIDPSFDSSYMPALVLLHWRPSFTSNYYGLFSNPRLIARTGAPSAYPRAEELRIPREHKLLELWEDNVSLKVHDILNQFHVNWSSTDIVRIAHLDKPIGNLILWIGVRPHPTPLSYDIGITVAHQCRELLLDHKIHDVDIELRQSDVIQAACPRLLEPAVIVDPTAILREPFATTVGITICA